MREPQVENLQLAAKNWHKLNKFACDVFLILIDQIVACDVFKMQAGLEI